MKKYKKIIVLSGILLTLLIICFMISRKISDKEEKETKEVQKKRVVENCAKDSNLKEISILQVDFIRVSETEIDIMWSDQMNSDVDQYYLMRRKPGESQWEKRGELQSDYTVQGRKLKMTDILEDGSIQQYEYRIDVSVADTKKYKSAKGKSIFASNILVCIDPGHFSGKNSIVDKDGSVYSEGDATLILAQKLEEKLKTNYGVTCILTRTYIVWKNNCIWLNSKMKQVQMSMTRRISGLDIRV